MDPDRIAVSRAAVRTLVDTLDDAWWMQAAGALNELRAALDEPQPDPDPFPTFGTKEGT
jgi:hypothetical protein